MSQLMLSELDDSTIVSLEKRAKSNGRTPAEEAKAILRDALACRPPTPWAGVDAIYNRLAESGRTFSDSVELLREDRDR
jgi:antitoxin FitA